MAFPQTLDNIPPGQVDTTLLVGWHLPAHSQIRSSIAITQNTIGLNPSRTLTASAPIADDHTNRATGAGQDLADNTTRLGTAEQRTGSTDQRTTQATSTLAELSAATEPLPGEVGDLAAPLAELADRIAELEARLAERAEWTEWEPELFAQSGTTTTPMNIEEMSNHAGRYRRVGPFLYYEMGLRWGPGPDIINLIGAFWLAAPEEYRRDDWGLGTWTSGHAGVPEAGGNIPMSARFDADVLLELPRGRTGYLHCPVQAHRPDAFADGMDFGWANNRANTDWPYEWSIPRTPWNPGWAPWAEGSSLNTSGWLPLTPPPPRPRLISVSPDRGPLTGGTTITIRGTHLTHTTRHLGFARDGNAVADPVLAQTVTDTQMVVVTPDMTAHGPGPVDLYLVSGPGNDVVTFFPGLFTYEPPPVLTAVNPEEGRAGTAITLTGEHLADTASVWFTNTSVTNFVVTDTTINVLVPDLEPGPYNVLVITAGAVASNFLPFTVLPPLPPPVLTSLEVLPVRR